MMPTKINESSIINDVAKAYNTRHEIDVGLERTRLKIVAWLTVCVLAVVCTLVYSGSMEGSGAIGILGATVGYIFGMYGGHQLPKTEPITPTGDTSSN